MLARTIFLVFCLALITQTSFAQENQNDPNSIKLIILRRPGIRLYQQLAEEVRERMRMNVEIRSKLTLEERRAIKNHRFKDFILAIGQQAYDYCAQYDLPIVHVFVIKRKRKQDIAIKFQLHFKAIKRALSTFIPDLKKVAVLVEPKHRFISKRFSSQIKPIIADSPVSAIKALHKLYRSKEIKALWIPADFSHLSPQVLEYAIALQFRKSIIIISPSKEHIKRGVLLSACYKTKDLAADIADRINLRIGIDKKKSFKRYRLPVVTISTSIARHLGIHPKAIKNMQLEIVD